MKRAREHLIARTKRPDISESELLVPGSPNREQYIRIPSSLPLPLDLPLVKKPMAKYAVANNTIIEFSDKHHIVPEPSVDEFRTGRIPLNGRIHAFQRLQKSRLRTAACAALGKIAMQEAEEILETWSQDPDNEISGVARRLLQDRERRLSEARTLVEGTTKPDDLLPRSAGYVWDGNDYVAKNPGTT